MYKNDSKKRDNSELKKIFGATPQTPFYIPSALAALGPRVKLGGNLYCIWGYGRATRPLFFSKLIKRAYLTVILNAEPLKKYMSLFSNKTCSEFKNRTYLIYSSISISYEHKYTVNIII